MFQVIQISNIAVLLMNDAVYISCDICSSKGFSMPLEYMIFPPDARSASSVFLFNTPLRSSGTHIFCEAKTLKSMAWMEV